MSKDLIANQKNIERFLNVITAFSEKTKKEIILFENEWKDDDSPPFNCLFSAVGKVIANDFYLLDYDDKSKIFSHIESGINSDDEYLATAVATGLVEALVTASDDNVELWNAIESYLGTESKKHAIAWRNFGQ